MESSENSKGWWAPIRSGLTTDPKHRKRMGNAIWVYLYLQTYADRETGWLFRSCKQISDDLEESVKTVRRQMEKLEDRGYIELKRKQYGFEIQITKWKPIKKLKGLAVAPTSPPGETESPRVDNVGQSDQSRVDTSVQSGISQSGHSGTSEWTFSSPRVDTSVQSLIRKFKESKEIIKKVVVETVNVDTECDRFLKFSARSHRHHRDCDLFLDEDLDRGRVDDMLARTPYRTLCAAWLLFLNSQDSYIVSHYPDRNIAIFSAQLRNFVGRASRLIAELEKRRRVRARSREPTIRIDSGKHANCAILQTEQNAWQKMEA